VKSWCIAKPSAQFVAKMEDVLDVYQRPYHPQRPVVCLDEARKELHATPRGHLPAHPGQTACQDYEYARQGVCTIFLAVEPLAGQRQTWVTERATKLDYAEVLRCLADEVYPDAETIVLVNDNLKVHSPAALYERFAPAVARRLATKFEWHYTPEHGSWLNIAECELAVLQRQCLDRRLADFTAVTDEVNAWQRNRNRTTVKVDWQFTTSEARIKLKRLYPVVKVQEST